MWMARLSYTGVMDYMNMTAWELEQAKTALHTVLEKEAAARARD